MRAHEANDHGEPEHQEGLAWSPVVANYSLDSLKGGCPSPGGRKVQKSSDEALRPPCLHLKRAKEGGNPSESTALCGSYHIPSFPFQMQQK